MITIANDINKAIENSLSQINPDCIFLLTDSNVAKCCLPKIILYSEKLFEKIVIGAGEDNKGLDALQLIWNALIDKKATRHSLLICLGGGMITDLGGFAASTYMRGMPYINIPTTLLATIDASIGGKTAINYCGLKNQIGVFGQPRKTIIYPPFFDTLPFEEKLSGYAEMVKHALIADKELLQRTLTFDLDCFDNALLVPLIEENLQIKREVVNSDPEEHGLRKILNFGHTIGHALESLSHETDHRLPHGYAVMWGMVAELYLSMIAVGLDKQVVNTITSFASENYPRLPLSCRQYDRLFDIMRHDKKNQNNNIHFTLLHQIGNPTIDCVVKDEAILEALDYITMRL